MSVQSSDEVLVRFNSSDYGILNETYNSYVTFTVERIGATSSQFSVIIEVSMFCCTFKPSTYAQVFKLDPTQGIVDDFRFRKQSWTLQFLPSPREREWKSTDIFVRDDNIPEDDEVYRSALRLIFV